jgi:uncharacterized damage-inducible protein DinB
MGQEFGGDLVESEFWGADLSRTTFRDVNLTGVRISHAWLVDVEIDALVDRVVINGVDVTDVVNQGDPWYPLRATIRPDTPEGMREARVALEQAWADALATARRLPAEAVHASVAGEWSLVQTLRHLLFAMDKWFTVPVLGGTFHPWGMPNTGSIEYGFPGLDLAAAPGFDEVLAARAERAAAFTARLDQLRPEDLTTEVDVMENGRVTLDECVYTVFEEEFWHLRYATRDVAVLAAG